MAMSKQMSVPVPLSYPSNRICNVFITLFFIWFTKILHIEWLDGAERIVAEVRISGHITPDDIEGMLQTAKIIKLFY